MGFQERRPVRRLMTSMAAQRAGGEPNGGVPHVEADGGNGLTPRDSDASQGGGTLPIQNLKLLFVYLLRSVVHATTNLDGTSTP